MARRRRTRQILSAASELRKGFTIPTHSKIRSALRSKSKAFIINLFLTAFSMLPKGKKLKLLVKIERGITRRIKRRRTRRKSRTRRGKRRKTRRRARRRKARTRRKKSKAAIRRMRLRNLRKARAAKRRRR